MTRRVAKPVELLECEIQRDVIELYERVGCLVQPTQQSYRRGSRRNPGAIGIPDLYVFPPRIDTRPVLGFASVRLVRAPFWHETKTPSGVQSDMQAWWQYECEQRGVGYVLGGVGSALEYLRGLGLMASPSVSTRGQPA